MELSAFGLITFLVGGMMFLFGLPMIFANRWFHREILSTIKEKSGLGSLQILSLIMAIFGLWILSVEYRLSSDMGWNIVIPILGYLTLIKGTLILWSPKFIEQLGKRYYNTMSNMTLAGIFVTAVGALMWWLTFSVY